MQVQINSSHSIECHDRLLTYLHEAVEKALGRFRDRIMRVEVHLSDENSNKKFGTQDKRCVMEARLERHQPLAVTCSAGSIDQAVDGALQKLTHLIEHTLGRLRDERSRSNDLPLPQELPAEIL